MFEVLCAVLYPVFVHGVVPVFVAGWWQVLFGVAPLFIHLKYVYVASALVSNAPVSIYLTLSHLERASSRARVHAV